MLNVKRLWMQSARIKILLQINLGGNVTTINTSLSTNLLPVLCSEVGKFQHVRTFCAEYGIIIKSQEQKSQINDSACSCIDAFGAKNSWLSFYAPPPSTPSTEGVWRWSKFNPSANFEAYLNLLLIERKPTSWSISWKLDNIEFWYRKKIEI